MASINGSRENSAWMDTKEEAIKWAQENLSGKWTIYKESFGRHDIVYKNH